MQDLLRDRDLETRMVRAWAGFDAADGPPPWSASDWEGVHRGAVKGGDVLVMSDPSLLHLDATRLQRACPAAISWLPPAIACPEALAWRIAPPRAAGRTLPQLGSTRANTAGNALWLLRNARGATAIHAPDAALPSSLEGLTGAAVLAHRLDASWVTPAGLRFSSVWRVYIALDIPAARALVLPLIDRFDAGTPHHRLVDALAALSQAQPSAIDLGALPAHRSDALHDLANQVAMRWLAMPAVTATTASSRTLPVLAVDLLQEDASSAETCLLGARWISLDPRHTSGAVNIAAWLDLVSRRTCRRHAGAALLELPHDRWQGEAVHELELLMPRLSGEPGHVRTRPVAGAELLELHPGLRLESGSAHPVRLLVHLARRTTPAEPEGARRSIRFVEPGVGRTYLVKGVRIEGRPELRDFAITGAGLTPYSVGGYMNASTAITGRAAMQRLRHRLRCGAQLEGIGGRTSPVLALMRFPGETALLPDGSATEAGVALRGFRSVLRVRSLDPAAVFYQSVQHAPLMGEAILQRARNAGLALDGSDATILRDLDRLVGGFDDMRRLLWPSAVQNGTSPGIALRRWLVAQYAPCVVETICARLALELGRDPGIQPVSDNEYVSWFAATLGEQLALWRRHRFLHDYHKPGIERYSGLMTLVESNVTLMAEFPDLDTAVFVDDDEGAQSLQLTARDLNVLRDGYAEFHVREREAARAVVKSLACAVQRCDADACELADAVFDNAYRAHSAVA
jgi:hypothetical protein